MAGTDSHSPKVLFEEATSDEVSRLWVPRCNMSHRVFQVLGNTQGDLNQ